MSQREISQREKTERELAGEAGLEELPLRPRRRLLAPAPLGLLGVLLIVSGFIVGVLVEKGQVSSSSASAAGLSGLGDSRGGGLSSRLTTALRGSLGSGAGGSAGGGAGAAQASSGAASGGGSGGAAATIGQVAFVEGGTLYVTDAEGNTVKVRTSAGSTVTKTVSSSVRAIRPGETVVVTGAAGTDGTIAAEAIRVGGLGGGAGGGGLGLLFGAGGGGAGQAGASAGDRTGGGRSGSGASGSGVGAGGGGGGEPALFGKGG